MKDYRYVADFYDAFHEATAEAIIYFAKLLKERYAGKIVGAFYGSYGCTDFFNSSTATSTLPILDSGYVDFSRGAAGVYNNREPGGSVAQRDAGFFRLRVRCLWRRRTAEPIWRTAFTGTFADFMMCGTASSP